MDISNEASRVPAFPQEIVDIIIDHLHDDPETLRKCSLVCQSWLPSTSLHIFPRTICLPPRKMRRKNWAAGMPLKTFVTPRIVRHTQKLTLTGFADGKVFPCSLVNFFEALDQIPNLRSLTVDLENVHITYPSSDSLPRATLSRMGTRHIHTLAISGACNPDFLLVLALIQRFDHILRLTLSHSILTIPSNRRRVVYKTRVDAIQCYKCFGRQVSALVKDCVKTESLLSIVIDGERDQSHDCGLSSLVDRTPNLEHLTYAASNDTRGPLRRIPPSLQSIAIRQAWDEHVSMNAWKWELILRRLALCPATIKAITVHLDIRNLLLKLRTRDADTMFLKTIGPMDWGALGKTLTRFPSLSALHVVLRDQSSRTIELDEKWSYGTFKLSVSNYMFENLPSHLREISSLEAEWEVTDRGVTD